MFIMFYDLVCDTRGHLHILISLYFYEFFNKNNGPSPVFHFLGKFQNFLPTLHWAMWYITVLQKMWAYTINISPTHSAFPNSRSAVKI